MFYVFLVGLAKLHCGATPPSVMVLFKAFSGSTKTIKLQNVYTFAEQSHVIFPTVLFEVFSRLQTTLKVRADTSSFLRLVTFFHPRDKPMNVSTPAALYFEIAASTRAPSLVTFFYSEDKGGCRKDSMTTFWSSCKSIYALQC